MSRNVPTPEATRMTAITRKEMTHSMVIAVNLSSVNVSSKACYHRGFLQLIRLVAKNDQFHVK